MLTLKGGSCGGDTGPSPVEVGARTLVATSVASGKAAVSA